MTDVFVSGQRAQLDEKRHVFVGSSLDAPDHVFIEFCNSEGEETRLQITQEAAFALAELLYHELMRRGEQAE